MSEETLISQYIYPSEEVLKAFPGFDSEIILNTISGKSHDYYINWLDNWTDGKGIEDDYIRAYFHILLLQKKIKKQHCG